MITFFLFIGALFGLWKSAQYVTTFVEEQWLLDPQKQKLQAKFEAWWYSVADMKPRTFACALARVASDIFSGFFGKRLFSRQAFIKAATIGTGLMLTAMVVTSFMGLSVKPWAEFDKSIKILKENPDKLRANPSSSQDKATIEVMEKLKAIAESAENGPWKYVYCVSFFLIIVAANAVSFFFSVALSRLMLQEIVAAESVFLAFALLAFDLFLVVCTASLFLLFATVLAFPGLWFFVALIYLLSRTSLLWLFVGLFGGGLAVWAFGNPALQIISVIAIVPCVVTALVCGVSFLALLNREQFKQFCEFVLLRCTRSKPLSFIAGFFIGVAILIAIVCQLFRIL
jgi:hypothetical protein